MKKKLLWLTKILIPITLMLTPIVITQINKPTSNLLQDNKIYSSSFLEVEKPEIDSRLTLLPIEKDDFPPCTKPGEPQLYYIEQEATDTTPKMISKVPYCECVKVSPDDHPTIDWSWPTVSIDWTDINDNAQKDNLVPEINDHNTGSYDPISFEIKANTNYYFKIKYDVNLWMQYQNKYLFDFKDKSIQIDNIDVFLKTSTGKRLSLSDSKVIGSYPFLSVLEPPSGLGNTINISSASTKSSLSTSGFYSVNEDFSNFYLEGIDFNINYSSSSGDLTILNSFAMIDKYEVQVSTDQVNFQTIASKAPDYPIRFTNQLNNTNVEYQSDVFLGYPRYYLENNKGTKIEKLKLDIINLSQSDFKAWKSLPTYHEKLDKLKSLLKVDGKKIIDHNLTFSNKYEITDFAFEGQDSNDIYFKIGHKYSVLNEYIPVSLHIYVN